VRFVQTLAVRSNVSDCIRGYKDLICDMSMFQGSSRIEISGGTFNAIARDQINHFNDTGASCSVLNILQRTSQGVTRISCS